MTPFALGLGLIPGFMGTLSGAHPGAQPDRGDVDYTGRHSYTHGAVGYVPLVCVRGGGLGVWCVLCIPVKVQSVSRFFIRVRALFYSWGLF